MKWKSFLFILFYFIFASRNSFKENGSENGEKKNGKKVSGRMKFGQVFRRTPNKDESAGFLFGLPLGKLCHGDKLPSPLIVSAFVIICVVKLYYEVIIIKLFCLAIFIVSRKLKN